MTIRSPLLSGAFVGRSLKTTRMPWFASGAAVRVVRASSYTSATSPSTANTKTSTWTQVVASTSEDANAVMFGMAGNIGGADYGSLFDLAVGASGAETVVAQNIALFNIAFTNFLLATIPVRIPAGSRVSWKGQCAQASKNLFPTVTLLNVGDYLSTPTSVDTYGVDTSISRATALTGTSGVTWTEIAASTSRPYQAIVVVPSNYSSVGVNANVQLTVGVGPSGEERAIGYCDFNQNSAGTLQFVTSLNLPIIGTPVPAGSRLSIRHNMAANPGYVQASIIGVPFP